MRPEHWLYTIPLRLRSLFRWTQANQELDDELREHLERATEEYAAQGMTQEEAHRRARLDLGGIEQAKEKCRDARRVNWIQDLIQDTRYGFRTLSKSPGYTAVAVITLALGIGANTAIFSMVDTLMLQPLPIRDPHRVAFLSFPRDATHFDPSFSGPEFRELREETQGVFSDVNAMVLGGLSGLAGKSNGLTVDGITKPTQTLFVSGKFFQMLGIRPYLGRFILPSEGNAPGGDPVVVLSYRYWKKRFHEDESVLNKPAFVNGHSVMIVGITPKGFLGPTPLVEMEAYLPLGMMTVETEGKTAYVTDPNTRDLLIVARLAPGVSIEQANTALNNVQGREQAALSKSSHCVLLGL